MKPRTRRHAEVVLDRRTSSDVLAADDVVDGAVDRVPDAGGAEHRPDHGPPTTTVTMPKAIDSRNDVFITDQGSIRVSRSRARRGAAGAREARRCRVGRDGRVGRGARRSAWRGPRTAVRRRRRRLAPAVGRGARRRFAGLGGLRGLVRASGPARPSVRCWARRTSPVRDGATVVGSSVGPTSGLALLRGLSSRCRPSRRLLHPQPHPAIRSDSSVDTSARRFTRRDDGRRPPPPAPRPGDSTDRATTATASPSLGVTNFTPIVERPVGRKFVVDRAAHDLAALGDREDLVAVDDDERADQAAAVLVGQRHRLDAEAAAGLQAVVR